MHIEAGFGAASLCAELRAAGDRLAQLLAIDPGEADVNE